MTTKYIEKALYRQLVNPAGGYKIYPNTYIGSWECDLLKITNAGYMYEYEIKVSKSDFIHDFEKSKKGIRKYDELVKGNHVNYFTYVVPIDMITLDDIPQWAGLIYVYKNSIGNPWMKVVRKPTKIAKQPLSSQKFEDCLKERMYHRYWSLKLKVLKNN